MQICVVGDGRIVRESAAAVKNFVRKRPQKGTKGTEDIFCAFCALWLINKLNTNSRTRLIPKPVNKFPFLL